MCVTCGCSVGAKVTVADAAGDQTEFVPPVRAVQVGADEQGRCHAVTIDLELAVLAKNDRIAARNRRFFQEQRIVALNLVSSPGSGKTTLLERTLRELAGELPMSVVEGDQETANDAERIRATGVPVVQINTGTGCHLEAEMIQRGLETLKPAGHSLLFVENVGNLVCPALFDLGERAKVVILSVTEGDDKPLKYPHMFRAAELVVINKVDLLPYVSFGMDRCRTHVQRINPNATVLSLSAISGEGLQVWYGWLRTQWAAASQPLGRDR